MIYGSHEAPNAKCTLKARAAAQHPAAPLHAAQAPDALGNHRGLAAPRQARHIAKKLLQKAPYSRCWSRWGSMARANGISLGLVLCAVGAHQNFSSWRPCAEMLNPHISACPG